MTIKGGDISSSPTSTGYGGGIYNQSGTLNLSGVTITGSAAYYGGGVYNKTGNELTISNSIINGNSGEYGGGIENDGSLTFESSSYITNNSATYHGGGVYNLGTLTVSLSTISSNSADQGGGVYNTFGKSLTITDSTVSSNTASAGGGVYNLGGSLTVDGSSFTDNEVSSTGLSTGGAVYTTGTASITDSSFTGNSSSHYAGAVEVKGSTNFYGINTFSGNTSVSGGDAIELWGASKYLYLNDSTLNFTEVDSILITSGNVVAGSSTVNYNGLDQNISTDFNYNNLTVSGGGTKTLEAAIDINGNLTIGSSTTLDVSASDYQINIAGNWNNEGTFTAQEGTVVFDGSGISVISGATSFYNFNCTTAGKTLTFATGDGNLQTVTGTFTIAGSADAHVTINSNSAGTQASISVGTSDVSYVTVQDSNNTGTTITPANSTNSGNNTGWSFPFYYYRTNASGSWNWNTPANWQISADGSTGWTTASSSPNSDNSLGISILSGANVAVDSSISIDQTTVNSGGQITVDSGNTLTVADGTGTDLSNAGTVLNSGSLTNDGSISISGTYSHAGVLTGNALSYTGATATLVYSGLSQQTTSSKEFASSGGPANLTVSNSAGVVLAFDRSLTGNFTVNSGAEFDGGYALSIEGNAEINGNIGSTSALSSLSVTGSTVLGSNVTTLGTQTYTGAVTVTSDSVLKSNNGTTAGTVSFLSTIDSESGEENSLVFGTGITDSTKTNVELSGDIGSTTPLSRFTVYGGTVLENDITVISRDSGSYGSVEFFFSINSASGESNSLTAGSSLLPTYVSFNRMTSADSGTLNTLTCYGPATFTGNDGGTGGLFTTGSQTYNGTVTVWTDLDLISGTGSVVFNSSVDSNAGSYYSLTIGSAEYTTPTELNSSEIGQGGFGTADSGALSSVDFYGAVTLGDSAISTVIAREDADTAGTVTFRSTLDSAVGESSGINIGYNSSGTTVESNAVFMNEVGGTTALNYLVNYGNVTVAADSSLDLTGNWDINGNFTIEQGITFTGTSNSTNISGNWNNSGTYIANSGTVVFDGDGVSVISGTTSFYDFTCTTAGKTLTFASGAGNQQTVTGTFTITGTADSHITINSDSAGTQAIINVGTSDVSYVTVQDSNNSGTAIEAINPTDGDNNTGWSFVSSRYYYRTNAAGSWNWSAVANWQISVDGEGDWSIANNAPNYANSLGITVRNGTDADNSATTVLVNSNLTIDQTVINSGATLSVINGNKLTINDGNDIDLTNSGILINSGTLTNNGSVSVTGTYSHAGAITGNTLAYSGLSSTLIYAGSVEQTTSAKEFAASGGPSNLTISNGEGVVLAFDRTLSGDLTIDIDTSLSIGATTLTVNGVTEINGTIEIGTGTVDSNGSFDATGGTIDFTGAGNLKLSSTVTSLGTLDTSSGAVWYDKLGDQTIVKDAYYNLTLTGSGVKTFSGNVYVNNSFTTGPNVTVVLGTNNLHLLGTWQDEGATFNSGTGTVSYEKIGNQDILENTYYNLVTTGSGVKSLDGNITVQNQLLSTSGFVTFALDSYTCTLEGSWTNTATFDAGTGTIEYASEQMSRIKDLAYYNLTVSEGNYRLLDDLQVNGNLNIYNPATLNVEKLVQDNEYWDIYLSGNFRNTASDGFAPEGGTLFLQGGDQTIRGRNFYNITTSGSGTKYLNYPRMNIDGDVRIGADTTLRGRTSDRIYIAGDWRNFGSFDHNGSNIWFDSSDDRQLIIGDNTFWDLTIENTSPGLGLVRASGSLTVEGFLRVISGTFWSASSYQDVIIETGAAMELSGDITVGGDWTNSGTLTSSTHTVTFNGIADQTITNSESGDFYDLTYSGTGSLNLSGTVTVSNNLNTDYGTTLNVGTSTLAIGGDTSIGGSIDASSGTIDYTGTDQTILGITYENLELTGSGTKTFADGVTVTGTFAVESGITLAGTPFTYGPTATLKYTGSEEMTTTDFEFPSLGGPLNLIISNTAGVTLHEARALSGDLTIEANAILNLSSYKLTISGTTIMESGSTLNVTGNNWSTVSMTANGGTVDYQGADQNIEAVNYYNLSLSGTGTKTLLGAIDLGHDITIGENTNLDVGDDNYQINIAGDWVNNGGSFTERQGTVVFDGTSQTIGSETFYNATVSSGGSKTLGGAVTINNNLALSSGLLTLGTYSLTLNSGAAVSGTPSSSNMIVTNSTGNVRKKYSGNSSFLFPVGTNDSAAEYSPVTVEFRSGISSGDYVDVRVVDSKEPSNTSTNNYLERYWVVESNRSGFNSNVTAQYVAADVVGSETYMIFGKYSNNGLTTYSIADTANHAISGNGLTSFCNITGVDPFIDPVPSVYNGMMINDGTQFQTRTSWRNFIDDGPSNSIDRSEGFEMNEVEGVGLALDSLITFSVSESSVADGEYSMTTGEVTERTVEDGEHELDIGVKYTGSPSNTDQEFNTQFEGVVDLSFNFEDCDIIDYNAIASYNSRHPVFMTELDEILEMI